jgi:hypothetical protein
VVITTPDGAKYTTSLMGCCHGIVIKKMELEPRDIRDMCNMLRGNPEELQRVLLQLAHRFESERYTPSGPAALALIEGGKGVLDTKGNG